MGKLDRISKAGLWPRALGADMAAIYCGVSKSQFYRSVEAGVYPKGFQNGGLVQWDRFDLDEAIEVLKHKGKSLGQDSGLSREIGDWNPGSSAR